MADQTIINYDELSQFVRLFQQEGEEYAALISKTRQMVHALEKDWIGLGADAFFDEFESVMLPALQRLQESLLFSGETLQDVINIFDEAENESGGFFRGELEGGDGKISGIDVGDLDFGLDGIQVGQSGDSVPPGGAPPPGPEAGEPAGQEGAPQEMPETAEPVSSGGGGGGSSGGSEGMEGELEMGENRSAQVSQQGGGTGGSSQEAMPDHIYQGSSARGAGTPTTPDTASPPSSSEGERAGQSGRGAAGIAGALGGAGAAAGAGAKSLKKDDKDDD